MKNRHISIKEGLSFPLNDAATSNDAVLARLNNI